MFVFSGSKDPRKSVMAFFLLTLVFVLVQMRTSDCQCQSTSYRLIEDLRAKLGNIHEALVEQHKQRLRNIHIAQMLESLVENEACGLPPHYEYTPAVDDAIKYLDHILGSTNEADITMRQLLYYTLRPAGTLHSQLALLRGLESAVDDDEKNSVLYFLAFVANPHQGMVTRLEELILSDKSVNNLLLAYGSIVSSASQELQSHMKNFLHNRYPFSASKTHHIQHILALGNTELTSTAVYLIKNLDHPDVAVQLTTILSLRSLLTYNPVQNALIKLLRHRRVTVDHVAMVANALLYATEEAALNNKPKPYQIDLVHSLVKKAKEFNDKEINDTIVKYLTAIDTKSSVDILRSLQGVSSDPMQYKSHNSSQWESWLIALLQLLRLTNIETFTNELAYAWKRQYGGEHINLTLGAGGHGSVSNNGEYTIGGHAIVEANIYDFKVPFLKINILRKKSTVSTESKLYVNVMGKILMDIEVNEDANVCTAFNKVSLYKRMVFNIINQIIPANIAMEIELKATLNITAGLELKLCDNLGYVTTSLKVTAGGSVMVEANVNVVQLIVAKAGLTTEGLLNYQLHTGLDATFFYTNDLTYSIDTHRLYNTLEGSKISVYPYFAWRGWCGWSVVCIGDEAFQNKQRLESLTWNLYKYEPTPDDDHVNKKDEL